LRGRVDGEQTSVSTAFDVSVHSTGAFIHGLLEDLGFPTVQECGVESIPCSIAVGEYERLLRVQSVLGKGVKLGGIPVNLDLNLGKGHRVLGICALSVGCEGDVGFVVTGVGVLWEER
jgi:hypothetical protein